MEAETISKNGRSSKSQTSRGDFFRKVSLGLLLAAIVVTLGMGLSACGENKAQGGSSTNTTGQNNYKTISSSSASEEVLNQLYKEGWEFVGSYQTGPASSALVLKRR